MPSKPTFDPSRSGDILLVEDSAKDARLIREVLRERGLRHRLHMAQNGEQALRMLRGEPPHADVPLPNLVLLDVNLPAMSGIEVLAQIKSDPQLRQLPVIMLSTSRADRDVGESYALHANSYLIKPAHYDDFVDLIGDTLHFWLERCCPPPAASRQSRGMSLS